jgi:hypothetical protein
MASFAEFHKQIASEILSATPQNTKLGLKDEYVHGILDSSSSFSIESQSTVASWPWTGEDE